MGLFSKIGNAVGGIIGDAVGLITGGTSGVTNGVGGILNDVTGVTSSAKQAQEYTQQNMQASQGMTLEQMAKSNEYAKEQMALEQKYYLEQLAKNYNYQVNSAKNAVQWQMQDLKKAGLNPILAAGYGGANLNGAVGASGVSGSGTSGSMGAPSGSTGTSGTNPIEIMHGIASAKKELAQAKLAETEELGEAKRNGWIDPKSDQEIQESKSRTAQYNATAKNNMSQSELIEAKRLTEKGQPAYLIGKGIEKAEKALGRKLTKAEEKMIYNDPDKFFDDMMKGKLK